jgi:hypothetical protein
MFEPIQRLPLVVIIPQRKRLAATFLGKTGPARIRHPELNWPQPSRPLCGPMLF